LQAVILAGGLGTRLMPLTETVPKPMVPVAGEPYLVHQLRMLARQDIRDVVLLTGYLGEQIEQYFGDGSSLGLEIRYSQEKEPLGTAGALRNAAGLLNQDFLLIYGDSYLPIHYPDVLAKLRATAGAAVIVLYDNSIEDTSVRNNIGADENLIVTVYEKNSPRNDLKYVDAGVLAFQRSVLDFIPASPKRVSLEEEVFPRLIEGRQMAGYVTTQRFYDIGTPERLQKVEAFIADDHHQNAI
jgi:NDP-sugar pyrophosphorylase family protein